MTDTAFYDRMSGTVLNLLSRFGQTVTLRSFTPGGGGKYDPNTGKAASNSQAKTKDSQRKAVVVDAPQNRVGPEYGQNLKEGTLIQDHNKWIYMDAKGSAPTVQDFVIINGIQFKIYDVQMIGPGGIPLYYLLVLRA